MDDERPLREARDALSQDDDPGQDMEPTSISPRSRNNGRNNGFLIAGILFVLALIMAGLFLPPISLGERLGLWGEAEAVAEDEPAPTAAADATAEQVTAVDGFSVDLDDAAAAVNVAPVALADLGGAEAAVPAGATVQGSVYKVSYAGAAPNGMAKLAVPAGASAEMLDLYGWDGANWRFVTSNIVGDEIVAPSGPLAQAYALLATASAGNRIIGAEVFPTQILPEEVAPLVNEVNVGTLTLVGGELQGELADSVNGNFQQFVYAMNGGVIVDSASLAALLGDPALQSAQIDSLVNTVKEGGYAGVNIDYQGVDAAQTTAFTTYLTNLAAALDAEGARLAVTLNAPTEIGVFSTNNQDWAAIGQVADIVYLRLPLNPTAYSDDGLADQAVAWATRLIERRKLSLIVSANAIDGVEGQAFIELPPDQALANFGAIEFVQGSEEVEPGTAIEVGLTGTASPLEWDRESIAYRYGYTVSDQAHTVWLGNESALNHRIRFANSYNLRGVAIRGLSGVGSGAGYAAALNSFLGAGEPPQPAAAGIIWTVEDETGGVVSSSTGEALSYSWEGTETAGTYTIRVDFAQGENVASLGDVSLTVAEAEVAAAPEPEPEEEPEPEPEDDGGATPVYSPGEADAVVNVNANVRVGPGLGYGVVAGGANAGTLVQLIGRSSDSSWLQIVLPTDEEGWIFSQLVTVNANVSVASLPVVEVDPPVASSGGGTSGGGSAPPPIPGPTPVGSFALGGQTHTLANPTLMAYAGMNWVKFQHKWGDSDDPNGLAGRIQQAHANGFKVLLSMPGSNTYPSSINYSGYVNFVGQVAALGPDAIEIWNEMNIDFEWPAGQIDPGSYVSNMLAPAYNAIKAANPSVVVISGAPAPTGFDNTTNAWSDARYMAGMAAAGGASYMDCVGVHYNEGILPPSATSGDPRVPSDYYTRYFWGMVNTYYNAFGGARNLCFTELGYLSGDGFPGLPANFSWAASTSVGEHAAWLAEAYSLSVNSGRINMMIVFNVDFTYYDPSGDPQAGFAMVRPDGSCPACDTLHSVTGGR
ncbi:MAG: SH3 domain-containing protein [Anaerolineales bacterium]|nr:SH3 domain-containing protein [Anaerolineales bacterium]